MTKMPIDNNLLIQLHMKFWDTTLKAREKKKNEGRGRVNDLYDSKMK